jgi:hypothetical protein
MRESSVFRRFLRRIPYSFSWVVRSGAITRPSFLLSLTTATHRPIDHALASLIDAWPALPPDTRKASWPSSRPLRGGNRQIRPTHVSIFNRLLDQFRHGLVAVNHVMRAAGKIGDSGLVRIDAHVVIEGRVHFTKMHGPIGNRGA